MDKAWNVKPPFYYYLFGVVHGLSGGREMMRHSATNHHVAGRLCAGSCVTGGISVLVKNQPHMSVETVVRCIDGGDRATYRERVITRK